MVDYLIGPQTQDYREPWNRIIKHWRRCNIPIRPGVSPAAIEVFQTKYRIALPADVRDYFLSVDGTGDQMDDEMLRFWPLTEAKPVRKEWVANIPRSDRPLYHECFEFADYCIDAWSYAVKLLDDTTQVGPVFRLGGDPIAKQITASFREFMTQYANDPGSIL